MMDMEYFQGRSIQLKINSVCKNIFILFIQKQFPQTA